MGAKVWAAGVFLGLGLLVAGLAMITAKEALWQLNARLYALIGVTAGHTRLWDLFTTTLGLGLCLVGLWVGGAAWVRRARSRER